MLLYSLFLISGSAYGIGEQTIILGSTSSWNLVEKRNGITETLNVRPHPVLALSSHGNSSAGNYVASAGNFFTEPVHSADIRLSFDEGHPLRFADSSGR